MSQSSKTRQRVQERRVLRRRQTQVQVLIGVVVAALVIAGLLILINQRANPPVTVETNYDGLEQSIDESSSAVGYAIGPEDAPVTLVDYSDFSCPHCRDLAPSINRLIEDHTRDGDLRVVFKPIAFVNPPTSEPAAKAAMCAGEQDKFWEMHDQIWALNVETGGLGSYTPRILRQRAEALGINLTAYDTCLNSPELDVQIEAIGAELQILAANGNFPSATPTLFVNGLRIPFAGPETAYDDLSAAIEAALDTQQRPR